MPASLTHQPARAYAFVGFRNCLNVSIAMSLPDLDALERKIDDLVRLCARLGRENRALKAQQHAWTVERARLIEKNELAKQRVEGMISRLKSLESDS